MPRGTVRGRALTAATLLPTGTVTESVAGLPGPGAPPS